MHTRHTPRSLSFVTLAAAISLVIVLLAAFNVWNARHESQALAEAAVQNTAQVVAQQLESSLDDIGTQLQVLADRYKDLQRLSPSEQERLHDQARAELPYYKASLRFVLTNDRGEQLFNSDRPKGDTSPLPKLADRSYFQRAQAGDNGLLYEGPVQAKLDKTWSILMAKRIQGRDQRFQGVVVAVVPTELLGQGFKDIDLGARGVLNLRTADLAQVVRYPALSGSDQGVGNQNVSATVRELIASQPQAQRLVYRAVAPIDGGERIYAYQKFARAPFWMTVGRATEDFEGGWRKTALLIGLTTTAFVLLLLWGARRLDQQQARLQERLVEREDQLSDTQTALEMAQKVAHIGSWTLGGDTEAFSISHETARLFDLKDDGSTTFTEWFARIHPEDQAQVEASWRAALAGAPYDTTYRIVVRENVLWIHARAELQFSDSGALESAVGTVQDITLNRPGNRGGPNV